MIFLSQAASLRAGWGAVTEGSRPGQPRERGQASVQELVEHSPAAVSALASLRIFIVAFFAIEAPPGKKPERIMLMPGNPYSMGKD